MSVDRQVSSVWLRAALVIRAMPRIATTTIATAVLVSVMKDISIHSLAKVLAQGRANMSLSAKAPTVLKYILT